MIQFSSNFTESFTLFNDEGIENDKTDNGVIQVQLDQTDIQKTSFMQRKIYDTYRKFAESLMSACGKSRKAVNSPIAFEALFGNLNFDLKLTLIPGFILG